MTLGGKDLQAERGVGRGKVSQIGVHGVEAKETSITERDSMT